MTTKHIPINEFKPWSELNNTVSYPNETPDFETYRRMRTAGVGVWGSTVKINNIE